MIIAVRACFSLLGFAGHSGDTVGQQRKAVTEMRSQVLDELFVLKPSVEQQIISSAVFDNTNVNLLLASFGAQADAAVKAGDKDGAVTSEVTVDNMTIYQITKNGLALQATIRGSKYWPDEQLNKVSAN
ncbi:hypothetical protein [Paraglaciecola sp. 25GB23A]|uniref:hypothetical protein n=1 Tax=Paraglaciecola sp. 25GB23A TaxID=3156068 RepID=UPI0032AFFB0F